MPKFRKPNRGRRAAPVVLSAPVGGLNGRDALAEMPHSDAFVLDDFFCASTSVDTRGGSLTYTTGFPAGVESLEVYTGAAGSKLLAFSNGAVYDASLGGAVGAALISGRTSNQVTSCMFSNAGSQFLLIYSGADQPLSFDGTTLAGLAITGLTGSQNLLFAAMAFKGRVFLAQQGTLGFYYLAVGAIQGAASFFDLQQQSVRGGSIAAICSFSQESGQGPQDYAVFVTSEGEYIMYAGTDPSNAATWALVGRYFGPPPIGKKSWFRFRSDLYFLTIEGILSFTQIREQAENPADTSYLTSKLGRNYTDSVLYQATHGWSGIMYPRGQALLVNVPRGATTGGGYMQFVMNSTTNAWSRYTGWNGLCFAVFNQRLYFGTLAGTVVLADEGLTDNGTPVTGIARQAWNTMDDEQGMGEADKQFHFATFALQVDGVPALSCALNVNFEDDRPVDVSGIAVPPGATWDTATWDVDAWAGSAISQSVTVSVGKIGYIASVWMQTSSIVSKVRWLASRIVLEKTHGVLLQ